jgi:hypothetical protein
VIVLLLTAVIAGALVLALLSRAEVLEKGQLLPYTNAKIYHLRLPGGLTFYVEPELKPSLDLLNAYLLTGIAFISLSFATLLARFGEGARGAPFRFFFVSFLGASYLVADELLGIHETIGHNLRFLLGLRVAKRPDDLVIMLMALTAGGVLLAFRRVILASRGAVVLFGAGAGLILLAAIADLLSLPFEEVTEVLAALLMVAGMMTLGVRHLRPFVEGDQRPTGGTT